MKPIKIFAPYENQGQPRRLFLNGKGVTGATRDTGDTKDTRDTVGRGGTRDTGDKGNSHDRTHRASTVSTAYKSLVHCTSIPNIPLPMSRWLFFPQRPVRRLNPLLCQEWCQYIENKPENAGRKTWHNYFFFFFFLKKTWIEENADWIWSAETLLRVFVWVSPLKTLKCIQTKTQRFIQ